MNLWEPSSNINYYHYYRSKWAFQTLIVLFALLMGYMLFAAGWLVYKGIKGSTETLDIHGPNMKAVSVILGSSTLLNIVISMAATYGLYFFASFLFFEPWHMFTSFLQYLFLVPFYVNIIMVYAFCNIHDVT